MHLKLELELECPQHDKPHCETSNPDDFTTHHQKNTRKNRRNYVLSFLHAYELKLEIKRICAAGLGPVKGAVWRKIQIRYLSKYLLKYAALTVARAVSSVVGVGPKLPFARNPLLLVEILCEI